MRLPALSTLPLIAALLVPPGSKAAEPQANKAAKSKGIEETAKPRTDLVEIPAAKGNRFMQLPVSQDPNGTTVELKIPDGYKFIGRASIGEVPGKNLQSPELLVFRAILSGETNYSIVIAPYNVDVSIPATAIDLHRSIELKPQEYLGKNDGKPYLAFYDSHTKQVVEGIPMPAKATIFVLDEVFQQGATVLLVDEKDQLVNLIGGRHKYIGSLEAPARSLATSNQYHYFKNDKGQYRIVIAPQKPNKVFINATPAQWNIKNLGIQDGKIHISCPDGSVMVHQVP